MQPKTIIWICVLVGSVAGGYVPSLWGAGGFSFTSILFSTAGAAVGIWLAFRISQRYF